MGHVSRIVAKQCRNFENKIGPVGGVVNEAIRGSGRQNAAIGGAELDWNGLFRHAVQQMRVFKVPHGRSRFGALPRPEQRSSSSMRTMSRRDAELSLDVAASVVAGGSNELAGCF